MLLSITESLLGGCALLVMAAAAHGQEPPAPASAPTAVTIPASVPLRVVLEQRVPIKRVGEPVRGRLLAPVYVHDRLAIPAESVVEGHIAAIDGVPFRERLRAILSGNLTPPRKARVRFDALVLSDGSRLPIDTAPSRGTAQGVAIAKQVKKQVKKHAGANDAREKAGMGPAAIRALQPPGKMTRLKHALLNRFPYHRQALAPGTLFSAVLQTSLTPPAPSPTEYRTLSADGETEGQNISARILTPITSASARRGTPVEAAVTRPQFSPDHRLLIPEGSILRGEVIEAKPARWWRRNGKLLFVFRQIEIPQVGTQTIQGYLEGMQADFSAHLAIDSEGAARARNPTSRFIFPAIASAAAGLSLHQDYNSEGVPDQDIGGRAESGAVGLGLIGTVLAQTSRTLASSIAFTGAGFSIYSSFITRGQDVALPVNTPIEVSLRRVGEAGRR